MERKYLSILILIAIVLTVSGCTKSLVKADLPESTTAKDIIPDKIDGYSNVNTNQISSIAAAAAVGVVVGATSENVELGYRSAKITKDFVECYQDAGAVDSGGFFNISDPRYGGIVAAVDKNQVEDPKLLIRCVIKSSTPFSIVGREFEPCSFWFKIETDYNEFTVIMAGTDKSVCETFCDNLPTCPPQWQ